MQTEVINTATDIIVDRIRELIVSGQLTSGTQLKNKELATRFGMSITPIREALNRLEKMGLVEYQSRKGWEVKTLDNEEMRQVYDIREYIERLAARCICERKDLDEIKVLENILCDYEKNLRIGNTIECVKIDIKFHLGLVRASRNKYAIEMMERLSDLIYIRRTMENSEENNSEACGQHMEILKAFKNGDCEAADKYVSNHISGCIR